ncbi:MAG TPA: FAD-dependent oxidoreductase [Thermoanaerobaculia bacterium]|nr:FAD-dependent oxidoreductase [Thermoanaerobaculia bacterium]
MTKPVLFAVDDDPEVLKAVERDLRQQYGERYRVMRAGSGASALSALDQLRRRNRAVALLLVDQRMPRMTGVELLEQAAPIFPDAKRVLLTAYADTDAAIRAINEAHVDYYLTKPWDPPAEHLYPVLDDLLGDWLASFRPPFEGVRVIGNRWSPRSFELRDFLSRHQVPYQWLDIESDPEAQRLGALAAAEVGGNGNGTAAPEARKGEQAVSASPLSLPIVVFPDGTHLLAPSRAQVVEKLGLRTQAGSRFYDVIIVGGGPAGLAAAVYGASEGLRTLMVEREAPGGQAGTSSRIENYLGFPQGLSGADLARRAVAQAARFGVEILTPQEVTGVRLEDPYRIITLSDASEVSCHALVVATGVSYRKLDIPGIDRLTDAGVYYGAALTEAMACKGEDVYLVGGANSAGQAAMYFSRYARRATMLVRGDSLGARMSHYLVEQIEKTANIEVRLGTSVVGVHGGACLEAIDIANAATGAVTTEPARSLFIFIGAQPRTDWLAGIVERDAHGFLLAGRDLMRSGRQPQGWPLERDPFLLETSVPGIFVAGDVCSGSVKRVATAVGAGSITISFVHQHLARL